MHTAYQFFSATSGWQTLALKFLNFASLHRMGYLAGLSGMINSSSSPVFFSETRNMVPTVPRSGDMTKTHLARPTPGPPGSQKGPHRAGSHVPTFGLGVPQTDGRCADLRLRGCPRRRAVCAPRSHLVKACEQEVRDRTAGDVLGRSAGQQCVHCDD